MAYSNLFHHHFHHCPYGDLSTYTLENVNGKYGTYNNDPSINDVTVPTKRNKDNFPPSHPVPDVFYEFHNTD